MGKRGYTPEQIIYKLREAEVLIIQVNHFAVVTRKVGVCDYTYYPVGEKNTVA